VSPTKKVVFEQEFENLQSDFADLRQIQKSLVTERDRLAFDLAESRRQLSLV
jgi:hypothetical protein